MHRKPSDCSFLTATQSRHGISYAHKKAADVQLQYEPPVGTAWQHDAKAHEADSTHNCAVHFDDEVHLAYLEQR
jgi:hypothetical protein